METCVGSSPTSGRADVRGVKGGGFENRYEIMHGFESHSARFFFRHLGEKAAMHDS